MQDPLITIRVVIFASWRKERTSLESTASVSHPRTRSSCGLWLPFLPSSKVWTIDSSWSLQNSSLVYLDGDFGLCLLWLDLPQTVQKSPASTRSGTVFRRSHRSVGSNRSATTDPFPPLESDLPVPQLTMWLLSTDSPVSPAFLRQVIHDFPFFKGRSDLWIFKLDGLPLRCDAKLMFDHPHSRLPSLLNS